MKKIKEDAAAKRAPFLQEMIDNNYTITELAIIHGVSPQAMGVTIKKAKADLDKKE